MKILISHATEDERSASLLKDLIERCSLKQIEVWFSSDQSAAGGIALGASWFSNLLLRLSETDMIVALITPASVTSPWLYFECGHLANKGRASIVPLTLGMSVADIPMPLSAYQGHDLSVSNSVSVFMQKLFSIAKVPYDEDMTKIIRDNTARLLLQASEEAAKKSDAGEFSGKNNLDGLRSYLDKRFLELHALLPTRPSPENNDAVEPEQTHMVADLRFEVLKASKTVATFKISVTATSSIQSVLDECYFKMDRLVTPYRYLQQWVVMEIESRKYLLTKGRNDKSPAKVFFDPTRSYLIRVLDQPIDPTKSTDMIWVDTLS